MVGWELVVGQDAVAAAAGEQRVLLPLPRSADALARLHGAQALACEWALDRLEEAPPPDAVVVRARDAAAELLAAVVGVGLRQALAVDGAADAVLLAGGLGDRRRRRTG